MKEKEERQKRPTDFIEMLRKNRGKCDVKEVLVDGIDVCLWYDLKTNGPIVFMSSWYRVNKVDGLIDSIQTIFDPRAFGLPPGKRSENRASPISNFLTWSVSKRTLQPELETDRRY